MYEFKENDLVAGNFDFRAEDVVAECFEETKTGRGMTAVSDKALKTRTEITHEYRKIQRNQRVGVSDLQGFIC